MQKKLEEALWTLCAVLIAFYLGMNFGGTKTKPISVPNKKYQEISLVVFKEKVGDELKFEISGPARVVFGKNEFVESDGSYSLKLGQFPSDTDKKLQDFAYVGNAKTKKFYPANSYPARGTEVRYRRFFQTKEAAISAGFIPSKLVK